MTFLRSVSLGSPIFFWRFEPFSIEDENTRWTKKNGTHKNILSSQNVKYLSTDISKQRLTMKFSLSIFQFDNIAFTHSSVKHQKCEQNDW